MNLKKYFFMLTPLFFLSLFFSSCIPAYQVEEKMYKIEKRITELEIYRDTELRRMKKEVESLLADNEKTKKDIKELMLRTSIIGQPIEEEGIDDSRAISDKQK